MAEVRICDASVQRAIDFQRDLTPGVPSSQVYGEVARRLRETINWASPELNASQAVQQLRDTLIQVNALKMIAETINPLGTTRVFESL